MTNKKFTPIAYLDESERRLLSITRDKIQTATSDEDLKIYESVLDNLMESAIKRYKKEQSKKEEKQLQTV
ncbi:hypothetical protein FIU87_19555 [Bacillus sp. THAF10]|nr:hypothetical protein FIU87_19555 [Bacillus sp. THAF10]